MKDQNLFNSSASSRPPHCRRIDDTFQSGNILESGITPARSGTTVVFLANKGAEWGGGYGGFREHAGLYPKLVVGVPAFAHSPKDLAPWVDEHLLFFDRYPDLFSQQKSSLAGYFRSLCLFQLEEFLSLKRSMSDRLTAGA